MEDAALPIEALDVSNLNMAMIDVYPYKGWAKWQPRNRRATGNLRTENRRADRRSAPVVVFRRLRPWPDHQSA